MKKLVLFLTAAFTFACQCTPPIDPPQPPIKTIWPLSVSVVSGNFGTTDVVVGTESTLCNQGCVVNVENGVVAKVIATPFENTTVEMSGDCVASNCQVIADSKKNVVVTYQHQELRTLTIEVVGDARVISSSPVLNCSSDGGVCKATVEQNSPVTLTAVLNGSGSANWSEPACVGSTCVVSLFSNKTVTLNFEKTISLIVHRLGSDAGQLIVNNQRQNLPYIFSGPIGSELKLEAIPELDDTFIGYENLNCSEPEYSRKCSFTLSESLDAGVEFSPFIHWVKTWSGAGASRYLHPTHDGGVLALMFGSSDISGTFMNDVGKMRFYEIDESGFVSRWSTSSASSVWSEQKIQFFNSTANDELYFSAVTSAFPRFYWGSIDAGALFGSGSALENVVVSKLNRTHLMPEKSTVINGATPGARFFAHSNDLIVREGQIDFTFSWLDSAEFDAGGRTGLAMATVDENLTQTPTIAAHTRYKYHGYTRLNANKILLQVGPHSITIPGPPGCIIPGGSSDLALLDSSMICQRFIPFLEGPIVATEGGFFHASRATSSLNDPLTLERRDENLNVLWSYVFTPPSPISIIGDNPKALFDLGSSVLLASEVRSGTLTLPDGNTFTCVSPELPGESRINSMLTLHDKQTGALQWAHCIEAKPTGAIGRANGLLFDRERTVRLGQGILTVGTFQTPSKIGSVDLRSPPSSLSYFVHLLIPQFEPTP